MAKIVLKDANQPSTKNPRVRLEKKKKEQPVSAPPSSIKLNSYFYLKLSIYLNIWLLKLVVYLLNKPFFDVLFAKLLSNIKQLM